VGTQSSTKRSPSRGLIVSVAVAAGTVVVLGALVVLAGSQDRAAAIIDPPPCVVGSTDCGPLPTLPTRRTPIPRYPRHLIAPQPGLLRPGRYSIDNVDRHGSSLRFSVPAGWRWNGRALLKGNAAVHFYLGRVWPYADPCHWTRLQHQSGPGLYTRGSGENIAAALAAQPMRHPTRPWVVPSSLATPVRGGGTARAGAAVEIRLTVPSHINFAACDQGQYRTWGVARNSRIQQGPGQRDLIWLASLNDGNSPFIVDAATFPSTPTPLVNQVDSILASVAFGFWDS
jgi:hypothetical protein